MPEVVWVLVTCNSADEASRIGEAALAARQASCMDVFLRERTKYFWPPKSGVLEEGSGALLVLETFDDRFEALAELVRKAHSDELPFIGSLRVDHVAGAYRDWMDSELAPSGNGLKAGESERTLSLP